MRRFRVAMTLALILLPLAAEAKNAAELQLAMKKLTVVGSALYVAAHPDDENTAMLAWFSNDRLYRTGYLSVTRGDGGQNLIGDEKGPLLGVIRTQELLEARKIDGAEQMFTRAIDFGYTKNPEETFNIWNRDEVLADVVFAIRKFQPDVIVTRFPTTGEGGHGQHTASAILAVEAFRIAADPTKYPEQLRYASPWQPKRIFWNRFSWRPVDPESPEIKSALKVDLGRYNTLLGRAYTEIAAESRSEHKSQGFGSAERRGTLLNYLTQLDGDPAKEDPFEGIDTSWRRIPGGETVGSILEQAATSFDTADPAKSIPQLMQALDALDRLAASDKASGYQRWLEVKRRDLQSVIAECAGISIDIAAADSSIVPGEPIKLNVSVVNRSDYPFVLSTVASRHANPGKAPGEALKNNIPVRTELTIQVPREHELTRPYWLSTDPSKGMFRVAGQQLIGAPESEVSIPVVVSLDDTKMHTLVFTVPAVFRRTDPVKGEQVRNVDVMPPVVANVDGPVHLFPDTKAQEVGVRLRSFADGVNGTLRLAAPQGWKVEPASVPVALAKKGDESASTFIVTPPSNESSGNVTAEVTVGDKTYKLALTSLEYDHIPAQRILSPATARVVRADVKRRGTRVGYIMGSGDEVPAALREAGYQVELLTDAELDGGDLSRYDAIVAGVRAYNTRKRLRAQQARLLEYVKNGGTYVVQYNTTDELATEQIGPYPFKISRDRVTVEEAPLEVLDPAQPVLNTPNRITAKDYEGWVQERGLYFTGERDPQYTPIFASADPGEKKSEGAQLFARYGKGVFIYTSLSWFRQLPAGVPGAYKMFVNLVSAE